jgi:hypothetical protein
MKTFGAVAEFDCRAELNPPSWRKENSWFKEHLDPSADNKAYPMVKYRTRASKLQKA